MFENKTIENSRLKIFTNLFLPNLIFIILMITLTLCFWRSLIPWWDYFLYGEESEENELEEAEEQNSQHNREKRVKTVKVNTPIFIKRISSTLFTKGRKRDKLRREINGFQEEQKYSKQETEAFPAGK